MEFLVAGVVVLALVSAGLLWAWRRAAGDAAARRAELEAGRERLVAVQRELDATRASFEAWKASTDEQRRTDDERRKEMENAFAPLAQQALKVNSEQFLTQAGESIEQRRKAIEALLAPLNQTLEKLQKGAQELEGKREKAYGSLESQIKLLQQATEALNASSRSLGTVLRGDARARGRWGEVALRNLAELAGMTVHCDFELQQTLEDGSRPDMVVNFPGDEKRRIPVDAKVPMDAYMQAFETEDPERRAAGLRKHAEALRNHVRTLARRDYATALGATIDVTVLFIPGDPILAAAHEVDPALQTDALESRVLLATPVTLMMLLHTVALFWQQSTVAENALKVWEEARDFRSRVETFADHLAAVGKGLDAALRSYDKAIGSYETRVLPAARRLEELEGPGGARHALPAIEPIARPPRRLAGADGYGTSTEA